MKHGSTIFTQKWCNHRDGGNIPALRLQSSSDSRHLLERSWPLYSETQGSSHSQLPPERPHKQCQPLLEPFVTLCKSWRSPLWGNTPESWSVYHFPEGQHTLPRSPLFSRSNQRVQLWTVIATFLYACPCANRLSLFPCHEEKPERKTFSKRLWSRGSCQVVQPPRDLCLANSNRWEKCLEVQGDYVE